jgi:hypothetical protein
MPLRLPIVSKFDPSGVNAAQTSLENLASFARTAGAIATAALIGVSYAAVQVGKDSVIAASNFAEVGAAVDQVFGDASKQLEDFAKTAPKALGQTRTQFLEAVKTFGIFGKAANLAGDDNAAFSKQLAILASDLASFNNSSVDEAITAIGAGLRGESEPLRRFGVLLDDATLKARAMEMGIYDGNGALTAQQKVLSAQAEILAQTTTQQGDFARTQDGLANSARTLTAVWGDLQIAIGQALMPAVQEIMPILIETVDAMAADPEFNLFLKDMAEAFKELSPQIVDLLPSLLDFVEILIPSLLYLIPQATNVIKLFNDAIGGSSTQFQEFKKWLDFVFFPLQVLITTLSILVDVIKEIWKRLDNGKVIVDVILGPIFSIGRAFDYVSDSIQKTIDWWNKLFGLQSSKPVRGINFSTGAGVPGVKLATGGIVMPRPGGTLATIGEGGQAEAVIPLDRLNKMMSGGGGGGAVYNINVSTLKADASVGEVIVNAIKKYERTSGAVFAGA